MEYNWTDKQMHRTIVADAAGEFESSGQQEPSPMTQINNQLGMYITV